MKKYLVWHVQGGLGKNVASTSLIGDLKKRYSDRKLVMVVSWPEIFLNNKGIDRLLHMGHTPHFYQDYIDGKDTIVFRHEAYNQTAHVNHSQHLVHNWCDLMGLEYKEQQPQIIINYAQQQLSGVWKRDKPTLILHTNGGPMQGQKYPYNWCRDMPTELSIAIVNKYKNSHHIFHICRKESSILDGVERVDQPLDNLQLFSILASSDKRNLIDSCLQHAAAAFQMKSSVIWVGTHPQVFGYKLHDNIVANKPELANQRIGSYMFDFNFENNIHECPYNSVQEMFDFNRVMARV